MLEDSVLVDVQHNAEQTKHQLKLLAEYVQSNGQPFKSQVFCTVHWAFLDHFLYLLDALWYVYLVQVKK
jgi:hypothetical protein